MAQVEQPPQALPPLPPQPLSQLPPLDQVPPVQLTMPNVVERTGLGQRPVPALILAKSKVTTTHSACRRNSGAWEDIGINGSLVGVLYCS